MYLIDTNILILAIAGKEPNASFLKEIVKQNQLVLSVIVIAEFLSRPSDAEQQVFGKLIGRFPTLEIKLSTAQMAAKFRRESKKTVRTALLDCLLAAQAYEHDLVLVTNNTTDFPMSDIEIVKPWQV